VALPPPDFVRGSKVDAVREFRRFVEVIEEPAAHLLAELSEIHNGLREIPIEDGKDISVRGLYCRKLNHWVVFYAAVDGGITIVYVASSNPTPFSTLESEAANRLTRLQRQQGT
jgi:hypothetical protein